MIRPIGAIAWESSHLMSLVLVNGQVRERNEIFGNEQQQELLSS